MNSNIFPFIWEDKKCHLEYEYLLSNEKNKKLRKFEERSRESNLITLYIENDKIITFETSVFLVESNIESHYYSERALVSNYWFISHKDEDIFSLYFKDPHDFITHFNFMVEKLVVKNYLVSEGMDIRNLIIYFKMFKGKEMERDKMEELLNLILQRARIANEKLNEFSDKYDWLDIRNYIIWDDETKSTFEPLVGSHSFVSKCLKQKSANYEIVEDLSFDGDDYKIIFCIEDLH